MRRIVSVITGLAVAAGLWFALAPPQLGGKVQMLAVHGVSMEPNLHEGDLAIVRRSAYGIGDVVAYRSELTQAILLHRIIAIQDGRYLFQGDANDFVDPDQPAVDAIVGKVFLRIPSGAHVLGVVSSPPFIAVSAGLLLFVSMLRRNRGSADKRSITMPATLRTRVLAAGSAPAAPIAGLVLVAIAVGALGIGAAAALAAPTTKTTVMPYTHHGTFSYRAEGPRSVYADGSADTGEAIFLNVSDRVRVRFIYAFTSDVETSVAGRIALRVDVSDAAGWSRTFLLQPPAAFEGTTATANGQLRLDDLRRKLDRLQVRTGVTRTIYQVILRPVIDIEGTVADVAYGESFTPSLLMEYDGLVLRYVPQPDAVDDPLNPSRQGAVGGPTIESAAMLRIAGRSVPAGPLSIAMAVLALAAGLAAWILLRAARTASELAVPAHIRARFADRLVELQRFPEETTVVIASAAGFERLAAASDAPILEHADRYGVSWLLREGETMYSFRVDTATELVLTPDAEFTRFLAGH